MHMHMYMSLRKMYMSLNSFLVNDLHMTITYVKVVMISCSFSKAAICLRK